LNASQRLWHIATMPLTIDMATPRQRPACAPAHDKAGNRPSTTAWTFTRYACRIALMRSATAAAASKHRRLCTPSHAAPRT